MKMRSVQHSCRSQNDIPINQSDFRVKSFNSATVILMFGGIMFRTEIVFPVPIEDVDSGRCPTLAIGF